MFTESMPTRVGPPLGEPVRGVAGEERRVDGVGLGPPAGVAVGAHEDGRALQVLVPEGVREQRRRGRPGAPRASTTTSGTSATAASGTPARSVPSAKRWKGLSR